MTEWQKFVRNQMRLGGRGIAGPKLVCIDLQPNTSTQAPDRSDIVNIGGSSDAVFSDAVFSDAVFSDAVFSVVAALLAEDTGRFVAEVEAVEL